MTNPPQKSPGSSQRGGRTGLIVGVTVALVVLAAAAVAITGFWAPGYFLSGDTAAGEQVGTAGQQGQAATEQSTTTPPTQPTEPAQRGGNAEDVKVVGGLAEDAATAINTRDADLAREISCSDTKGGDFSKLPKNTSVRVIGDPVVEGDAASVPFEITIDGDTRREPLTLTRENGSWCVG